MNISKTIVLALGFFMLASTVMISNEAFAGESATRQPVGGLPVPLNESEVYGEIAKEYSIWLIPAISAIGIGVLVIKKKF